MSEAIQPVTLPASFTDPNKQSAALEKAVRERIGAQWSLASIDMEARTAYFAKASAVATVSGDGESKLITLPADVRPTDGERQATIVAEMYPGFTMVEFDPYLHRARLARLSEDELRARQALAYALGVKPWDVQVATVKDGFDVHLPASYTPSKHDKRLEEVVTTVIGRPGWYMKVDVAELTMAVRAGTLPTFPPLIPYPLKRPVPRFRLSDRSWAALPLGVALPEPGQQTGAEMALNLLDGIHTQLGGLSGAGKSVDLNTIIAGFLVRGGRLAIVDTPAKSVDFMWAKRYTMEGAGWGCDSLDQAVAVLGLVLEEGQRRAEVLRSHGVVKWTDLPDEFSNQFRPVLVVADEVTSLFFPEEEPKSLPKVHPLRVEAQEINLKKALLKKSIKRIAAEMRFVGIGLLLATQVASATTGITPDLRTNLQNKILKGSAPTKAQRSLVFSDPDALPPIPEWVAGDPTVARGVGLFHPEGRNPVVYKGFYACVDDLAAFIDAHGVPTTTCPHPSAADVARLVPTLADGDEDDYRPPPEPTVPDFGEREQPLRGAARASHQLAMSAAALRERAASPSTTGAQESA